jgi:hypothetical protein
VAENYYKDLIAELQMQKDKRIKEKAKAVYLNALLIIPSITLDQCEALLKAADETNFVGTITTESDLPF